MISTATLDAAKKEIPLSILQRDYPFPNNINEIPSIEQVANLPDEELQRYLMEFHKINKNPEFLQYGNFTKNDDKIMEAHAGGAKKIARQYGLPEENLIEGAKHHVDYDGTFGYPNVYVGKDLPISSRASSIVDAAEAIGWAGDNGLARYGKQRNSLDNYLTFLQRHNKKRGVPSSGTQFDPMMIDHYIQSGLAEKHYNELFNKNGEAIEALEGLFSIRSGK